MKKLVALLGTVLCTCLYAQTPGNTLNFDGSDDMVVCPTTPALFSDLTTHDFTYEAWVNPSASAFSRIIFIQASTSNFATMSMNTGNIIYFYVIAGGITHSIATTSGIPASQWTHVACVWTASTNTINIYFNGVLQAGNAGGSSSTGTNGLFTLGTRPGGAQYFSGSLDEVRVWSEARDQCEIINNMNSEFTAPVPNLVAYYNFNQGVPGGSNLGITSLADINGTFNGTLSNFTLTGTTSNWITSNAGITNVGPHLHASDSIFQTICANDTFMFGGIPRTVSGAYLDTVSTLAGCDSIVTLHLDVLPPLGSSWTISTCDQYVFNSTTLTASGMYYDTIPSFAGCDSIISLDLTLHTTQQVSVTDTACSSYLFNGNWLTTSGSYTDTLSTFYGCDSIITLHLTLHTVDVTVNQSGNTLSSPVAGATYQWLDCGSNFSVINGATSGTYTAVQNGSYALQITQNGCSDTSACFTINTMGLPGETEDVWVIYPNPTDGWLQIRLNASQEKVETIEILDANGRVLQKLVPVSSIVNVDLGMYSPGVYFIKAMGNLTGKVYRIIKK